LLTNNASEFWKTASAGVHKYEKESGVQVDIKMPAKWKSRRAESDFWKASSSQGYNGNRGQRHRRPQDQIGAINKRPPKTIVICHDSDAPKSNRRL